MRRNLALPQSLNKLLLLIQLVRAQRDGFRAGWGAGSSHLVQHGQRRLPLRRRTGLRGTGRHHQTMTVLNNHVPQITGLGLARRALLIQARLRVRPRLMGVAQTFLAPRSRAFRSASFAPAPVPPPPPTSVATLRPAASGRDSCYTPLHPKPPHPSPGPRTSGTAG